MEIANDVGRSIVKAYESITYFNSILQHAIKTHQSYLDDQKEKQPRSDTELPWWRVTREELSDDSPASQEDWDQEVSTYMYLNMSGLHCLKCSKRWKRDNMFG